MTDEGHYWGQFDSNRTTPVFGDNEAVASKTDGARNRINLFSQAQRAGQGGAHAWAWGNVGFAIHPWDRQGRDDVVATYSATLEFSVTGNGTVGVLNPVAGDGEARTRLQVNAFTKKGTNSAIHGGEWYDEGATASSSVIGGSGTNVDYQANETIPMPNVTGRIGATSEFGPDFKWYVRGKSTAEAEAFGGASSSADADLSEVDDNNQPSGSEYLQATRVSVTIESPSTLYWFIGPNQSGTNCI